MGWLARTTQEDEAPNIEWLISVFPGNKKVNGKPDPIIKSWAHPLGALNDLLKKICNLKGALMFCPYQCPNGHKLFSSGSKQKEWKYYQGIIHNPHHGRSIETDHHVICSIPEDMARQFKFYNFITPVPGTFR